MNITHLPRALNLSLNLSYRPSSAGANLTAAIEFLPLFLSVHDRVTLLQVGDSEVGLAILVSIGSAEPIFPNVLTNEESYAPVMDVTNVSDCAGYAVHG